MARLRLYRDYLEREQLLDFGDLIFRSVRLLRDRNPSADVLSRFKRSSSRIPGREPRQRSSAARTRGKGTGLWAVGCEVKSIYRWRGASTANIRLFERDFPDTVHSLSQLSLTAADPLSFRLAQP